MKWQLLAIMRISRDTGKIFKCNLNLTAKLQCLQWNNPSCDHQEVMELWWCQPMQIHLTSAACDIISFNGQGQLCKLTCAGWRDLSNHKRLSMIQSRRPEKKAKNHVTLTQKFPWKSCSSSYLPFLSSNPKILKAFPKTETY